MPHIMSCGTLCARVFVALIGLQAALFAPTTAAEIYQCIAKNGLPLYQNFPCHLDSVGLLPSTAQNVNASAVTGPHNKEGGATPPVNRQPTQPREPKVGMRSDEVTALIGEPVERIEEEPAEGGRISVWRYADGRSVQFDHRQRVLEVQR